MLKAAVIGCGAIGGGYDTPDSPAVATHAHAFALHPKTTLLACVDPSARARAAFCAVWGANIEPFADIETMLEAVRPDVVALAAPTRFHAPILASLLKHPAPTVILCEKPLVETAAELASLEPLLARTDKKLMVNFIRRYDPSTIQAARLVHSGALGPCRTFNALLTKGLYHNGGHMLALLEHILGALKGVRSLHAAPRDDDVEGLFSLRFANGAGTLAVLPAEPYALFELDLLFEQGRITIKESGHRIEIVRTRPSERYAGYTELTPPERLPDTLERYALHALDFALEMPTQALFSEHLLLSKKMLAIRDAIRRGETTLEW